MAEEDRDSALIAMSGGVDSTLAAKLTLDAGLRGVGCMMKLHGAQAGAEDAQGAAERLGIPLHVLDFSEEFERRVIRRFVSVYEAGGTPNPCIDCNRFLKFGALQQTADELGCRFLVTGHYARVEERSGRWLLKRAADRTKDQTYFLYTLTQAQLERVRFPLGGLEKSRVRALAEEFGFRNADRPDSQDICFVPDGDYAAVIERYTPRCCREGDFLDREGAVVGRHRGAVRYTLGQRRGLGLPMGEPVYVCAKNMAENTVTVGPESALYSSSLLAGELNWIAIPELDAPMRVAARIRHSRHEQPATVLPAGAGLARVEFDAPQRAVTPGQAVVLYDGDTVVGGGTILSAE